MGFCALVHVAYLSNPAIGDDLCDVMDEVIDVAGKWKALGIALGLRPSELDTFEIKYSNDPTECLRETLIAWLQQRYEAKKNEPPSWDMLCEAVEKRTGGNNPALAKRIAQKKVALN